MEYVGCYRHTCFKTKTNRTVPGIDECTQECKSGDHESAALSHGQRCLCGSLTCSKNVKVCESSCGFPCLNTEDDALKTCGGMEFIQVYKGKI